MAMQTGTARLPVANRRCALAKPAFPQRNAYSLREGEENKELFAGLSVSRHQYDDVELVLIVCSGISVRLGEQIRARPPARSDLIKFQSGTDRLTVTSPALASHVSEHRASNPCLFLIY